MNSSAIPGAGAGDQPPKPISQLSGGSGKEPPDFNLGGNGGGDQPPDMQKAGGSNGNGNEPATVTAGSGNGVRPGSDVVSSTGIDAPALLLIAILAAVAVWLLTRQKK